MHAMDNNIDTFYPAGSGGFKVFHPMVYQRVIESLHLSPEYEKSKCVSITITIALFDIVHLYLCTYIQCS